MRKRHVFFLSLVPFANVLWAFWALPEMHEEGTPLESLAWIGVQSLLPLFLGLLSARGRRSAFWMTLVYGSFILLFCAGTLGWALMGPDTPAAVYTVCALFFIVSLGLISESLKRLKIGQKIRRYEIED